MTKIIAPQKALLMLSDATNKFVDIAACGVITNPDDAKESKYLEKYEVLMKKVWQDKDLQELFIEAGFKKKSDVEGFLFGEPFFNFWLIEHGKSLGIEWTRIATKMEDFKGLDAFGTTYDGAEKEELGFQHKMYAPFHTIKQKDLAGLGWAPIAYKPVLVTTAWEASHHIKDRIEEREGACILRQDILDGTENPNCWNNYAELLRDNVIEWDRRTIMAEKEAFALSNRLLYNWQDADIKTLSALDRGINIAPPGSGKTTVEAKLAENWMIEEGE